VSKTALLLHALVQFLGLRQTEATAEMLPEAATELMLLI